MNKAVFIVLVILSGLLFSACDLTDQAKTEDMTDEELLRDLSSTEPDLSSDFKDLEAELSQ